MSPIHTDYLHDLLRFIDRSPTSFHAVHNICELLLHNGFRELKEHSAWQDISGGKYFVQRNSSSLIIFTLIDDTVKYGLRMAGAHTDSPGLKIKPNPGRINNSYLQLGVETYGGGLLSTWFDRDLSIAGRVTWKNKNNEVYSDLINFNRPLCIIPSLAIHLDREANDKKSILSNT